MFDVEYFDCYLPTMIDLFRTRAMPYPLETVWAVVADYDRDPQWRLGVSAMSPRPPGPVRTETTTCEKMRMAGRSMTNDGQVTDVILEPGRRSFHWRTTSGATAHGSRTLVALTQDSCELTLVLRVEPTGFDRLVAPVLGVILGRRLSGDLDRLTALLQRT